MKSFRFNELSPDEIPSISPRLIETGPRPKRVENADPF